MAEQVEMDFGPPLPSLPQLWTPDDIFESCTAETIQRFKEDHRVERKPGSIKQNALSDYVSMWANTQPHGGVTLLGVADNGRIIGCKHLHENQLNDIRTVRRLCLDAKIEFKRVAVKNAKGEDDFVEVMRVYYCEDKLVETVSGEAFVREGDQKRSLREEEKREIKLNKGQLDLETERVSAQYPNDFDSSLLATFRQEFIKKRRLQDRFTIEDVLAMSKLGKKVAGGFSPNLGCALLFARDPRQLIPGAFIRVIRYEGTEEKFGSKLNVVADRVIDGPLPIQIANAVNFITPLIRSFTRLGVDQRFETRPEFPDEAWSEAIVNAVVHRSYNLKNMNIFVKLFEDRLVVESPGAFLPPTTASTVFEAHNPRNPNTMWALYYFDFVQCAFEGTRRMRDTMRNANLPDPIFVQNSEGTFRVTVTLKNHVEHRRNYVRSEAAAGINPELYASLSESEKMIVNYLADNPRVNVTDAGRVIALGWRATKRILDQLEKKAVVERSGEYRSRHLFYFLKNRVHPK
ncbi:MAG TPA: ATP-binding protein [Steroidobacteraceae bacterium]|jgi:ATP-dependent DNA helicase RecG